MKILVREWNEKENRLEYVWKKIPNVAGSIKPKQFKDEEGNFWYEHNTLKIVGDLRKTHGHCTNCGKLVKKGDEEKHYAEVESNINCFECHNLSAKPTGGFVKRKFTKQEDGTYIRTIKDEVKLCCSAAYYTTTIEEMKEKKIKYCKHFKCRYHGVSNFTETLFMKYPKMYEELATEKSLIENKFTLDCVYNSSHVAARNYRHNRIKNLTAIVDDNGIIVEFHYLYRGTDYRFIYAKAYDMFFSIDYNGYRDFSLGRSVSDTTIENIKKAIRNVYVGGTK